MSDCTEMTCPYHGERNRARLESQQEIVLCECGYPDGSFACKIRHVSVQTGWAKRDH